MGLIIEFINIDEVKVTVQRRRPKIEHIIPDSVHMDLLALVLSPEFLAARGGIPQRAECPIIRQMQLSSLPPLPFIPRH